MARWQLHQAKQQFSRLVELARNDGPQLVTRNGKDVAVLVGIDDYLRLRSDGDAFKRLLLAAPDFAPLELERTDAPARSVEL